MSTLPTAAAITPDFLALVQSFLPPYLAAGLDMDAAIVEAVRDVRDWAADRKARLASDPAYKAKVLAFCTEQVWLACRAQGAAQVAK